MINGESISLLYCIPFVCMLASIAVFPLIRAEWWDKNKKYVVILLSLAFLIPFAIKFGPALMFDELAETVVGDYLTFIILLFGLFCVSGNITLDTALDGAPRVNTLLLLVGMLLSSWVGTTGASMIMIRPILRANKWRKRKVHTIVFFIFMVSNMGGVLTPVGDPPLLMGFMRGVPFFWSLRLSKVLIINAIVLLVIYYLLERRAYFNDRRDKIHPKLLPTGKLISLEGGHNLVFMGMIILAVILNGIMSKMTFFEKGIPIIGEVKLTYAAIIEITIILFAAFMSFKTTKKEIREKNEFNWDPIKEVAILFIGIFITMIPALLILEAKGSSLGITEPWEMFWVTGVMSSFLDNTPTYLVFLTTAGTLGATSGIVTTLGTVSATMLSAISCAAVFMGANTYIGNAPNFMVKSIAESSGLKMPSFFGYMWWSIRFLIPVFILDTLLFFL